MQLGARGTCIAPRKQIVQHEVLEVGTGRLVMAGQVEREPDVAPEELGALDEPRGAVRGEGWQADDEVRGLEERRKSGSAVIAEMACSVVAPTRSPV